MFLAGSACKASAMVSLRMASIHLLIPSSVNDSMPKSCLAARLLINGLGQRRLSSWFLSIVNFERNHLFTALMTLGSSMIVDGDRR